MSASILDTLNTNIEQVRSVLANYSDTSKALFGMLKINEEVVATRYLYRVPFKKYVGGTFQKYSADGGSMGTGNGMSIGKLEAGFFDTTFNFEITKEQIDTSISKTGSTINVMSETVASAMDTLQIYDDIALHTDGTGKLTNAASTGTATTLTFADASDTLGINRLLLGMSVDIWDSTGATKRAGGPYQIVAIDPGTKTVTFGSAPTGMATTDLIAFYNLDVYGPSTLTSFSSTWPGGGLTTAAGLTGDSFRHGLGYVNDNTTSNYYLGNLKSSIPQLMPGYVNASGALVYAHGDLLKSNIFQQRDETALQGMMGVMHMAQQAQLKNIGVSISNIWRGPEQMKMIDVQPTGNYTDTFTFADLPCFVSKRQDKSRVDFFNPKNWFKVESEPAKFYSPGSGGYVRPKYDGSGNVTSAVEFKVVQKMDTGCVDPGAGGYIYGCTIPSGY